MLARRSLGEYDKELADAELAPSHALLDATNATAPLLGSVAPSTLKHAGVPVLIVK